MVTMSLVVVMVMMFMMMVVMVVTMFMVMGMMFIATLTFFMMMVVMFAHIITSFKALTIGLVDLDFFTATLWSCLCLDIFICLLKFILFYVCIFWGNFLLQHVCCPHMHFLLFSSHLYMISHCVYGI
jgi:hypothetical protein